MPKLDGKTPPDETATIMWWAWGCHRAVDYLVTDKSIDAKRLAVVGHPRLGKTALLGGCVRRPYRGSNSASIWLRRGRTEPEQERQSRNREAASRPRSRTGSCTNLTAFGDDVAKFPSISIVWRRSARRARCSRPTRKRISGRTPAVSSTC